MAHLSEAPVVVVAVLMVFTDAAEAQAASPVLLSPLIIPKDTLGEDTCPSLPSLTLALNASKNEVNG